jgi:hypothetical protein
MTIHIKNFKQFIFESDEINLKKIAKNISNLDKEDLDKIIDNSGDLDKEDIKDISIDFDEILSTLNEQLDILLENSNIHKLNEGLLDMAKKVGKIAYVYSGIAGIVAVFSKLSKFILSGIRKILEISYNKLSKKFPKLAKICKSISDFVKFFEDGAKKVYDATHEVEHYVQHATTDKIINAIFSDSPKTEEAEKYKKFMSKILMISLSILGGLLTGHAIIDTIQCATQLVKVKDISHVIHEME